VKGGAQLSDKGEAQLRDRLMRGLVIRVMRSSVRVRRSSVIE